MYDFLFRIILTAWMISELFIWIFTSAGKRAESRNTDRGSVWGIVIGYGACIWISSSLASSGYAELHVIFGWAGQMLMAFGIALRSISVWTLKSAFSLSVTVKSEQSLIHSGPYRYLRHPAYTGSMLTLLGLPLVMKNALAILPVLGICAAVYGYRIYIEEALLRKEFGQQYQEYCKETWRLIPWVW